jgi:hypothetical protein
VALEKFTILALYIEVVGLNPVANPTTAIYKASIVKIYNAMSE